MGFFGQLRKPMIYIHIYIHLYKTTNCGAYEILSVGKSRLHFLPCTNISDMEEGQFSSLNGIKRDIF